MEREKIINELEEFLIDFFNGRRIQGFDTRNLVGDYMENIYMENGVMVDFATGYDYIEIFGLTADEFQQLKDDEVIY